jgi:putative phosphoribosyl transferase
MRRMEHDAPASAEVAISSGDTRLGGTLEIPGGADGVVLFAHGSGSSRFSPRNRQVAEALRGAGVGTLLFDLLTDREAGSRANVFDLALLARRLADATAWVRTQQAAAHLAVGYFGASTGAAAALIAAADDPTVAAVVSRGGRPDLAEAVLDRVAAPTLLIVGGDDVPVLDWNRQAYERLRCEKALEVVPGAGHLFEEPGTLDRVVALATSWFSRHLTRGRPPG